MNVQNEDLIRYLEQFPPEAEVQTVLVGFEQQKFYSADPIRIVNLEESETTQEDDLF